MITEQHTQEQLSRAYLQAIAAQAGLSLSRPDPDYGVDGSFHLVVQQGKRHVQSAKRLEFQLKASTRWQQEEAEIIYDLEAQTYNDLVERNQSSAPDPCVLILLALPPQREDWLRCSEESLQINGGCYWVFLKGSPTENAYTVRIRIKREWQLTPDWVTKILIQANEGEWEIW